MITQVDHLDTYRQVEYLSYRAQSLNRVRAFEVTLLMHNAPNPTRKHRAKMRYLKSLDGRTAWTQYRNPTVTSMLATSMTITNAEFQAKSTPPHGIGTKNRTGHTEETPNKINLVHFYRAVSREWCSEKNRAYRRKRSAEEGRWYPNAHRHEIVESPPPNERTKTIVWLDSFHGLEGRLHPRRWSSQASLFL